MAGYDPLVLTKLVERKVVDIRDGVQLRRYFRFRVDRWYGGIVTGDVVGCNLRCGFCWAWRFTWTGYERGIMLSPEDAWSRMVRLAKRRRVKQARVSGGEPTIGFDHLVRLVELAVEDGFGFVLETNGILIGANREYAKKLASFAGAGIEVRVSLKGTSPQEFIQLTKAVESAWYLQLRALEFLIEEGLKPCDEVYAAVMLSFSGEKGLTRIKRVLSQIHPDLAKCIDPEYVILYPHVKEILKRSRLKPLIAYRPDEVPPELV